MSNSYIQLRRLAFFSSDKVAEITFSSGVNVICGASDTGKSFLAESIDYMLGGTELKKIPELLAFSKAELDVHVSSGDKWRFDRAISGGNFKFQSLSDEGAKIGTLKGRHEHSKVDNLSGFFLNEIGLLGRRILKSKRSGTTQSLSFRNLVRLAIVQENEIQQVDTPFWSGQFTSKSADLATVKLLLTGIDDSDVVSVAKASSSGAEQIRLIDELLTEIRHDLIDSNETETELKERLDRLEAAISHSQNSLNDIQVNMESLLLQRRTLLSSKIKIQARLDEIADLLTRFDLLSEHYEVDIKRLVAIEEAGAVFYHLEPAPCPLCGALFDIEKHNASCNGDIEATVQAAAAETKKIEHLKTELQDTIQDLKSEKVYLEKKLSSESLSYEEIDTQIQKVIVPSISTKRASFSELVEKRTEVLREIEIYLRIEKLEERKIALEKHEKSLPSIVDLGLPDSVTYDFSLRVSRLLKAWDFPGDGNVFFDKETSDFIIDGKPRGSYGKGLRAITHAAITIALLEYCLENDMPHPGFVVLDSPLLAYFKPENDEDRQLQGTNLKENFYSYLIRHHRADSQIIIIENQRPPSSVVEGLNMTVFTGNPNEGRRGFL